jgi:hypothetical protein
MGNEIILVNIGKLLFYDGLTVHYYIVSNWKVEENIHKDNPQTGKNLTFFESVSNLAKNPETYTSTQVPSSFRSQLLSISSLQKLTNNKKPSSFYQKVVFKIICTFCISSKTSTEFVDFLFGFPFHVSVFIQRYANCKERMVLFISFNPRAELR